jgi:hypothetical protein
MTLNSARRMTTISASAPSAPRLRMEPTGSRRTMLDGGWWPRSTDPVAELPGLVLAIDALRGPVTRLLLSAGGWDEHPRRLGVAGRILRLGYFTSQTAALLTALCDNGDRVDLLIVPPDADGGLADAAMVLAATTSNLLHARHILVAAAARTQRTDGGPDDSRETDGGNPPTTGNPAWFRAPHPEEPAATARVQPRHQEGHHGQQDHPEGQPEEAGNDLEGKTRREEGQEGGQVDAVHATDRPLSAARGAPPVAATPAGVASTPRAAAPERTRALRAVGTLRNRPTAGTSRPTLSTRRSLGAHRQT